MSELSVFIDKSLEPSESDLEQALGTQYPIWQQVVSSTYKAYPEGKAEWNFPGKKYGWSYRIKDKKRAILYFLPRSGFFKVAFIFGDKAIADIMKTDLPEGIKTDLQEARKYAEGRGVSIEVVSVDTIPVIEKLIEIKLAH